MYSLKVINKVIDGFEAINGWRPERHSVAQVEEFDRYISSLIQIERTQSSRYIDFKPGLRLTETRKAQIKRWVENEQFLCFADCAYWETRYGWICDDKNNIFRYSPRKSQQIFDSVLAEFDEQQVAIELFCVKSRQVGISTDTVMKFHHRVQFIPNTQAVMASARAEQSDLLGRMGEVCRERQPFWLVPPLISTKSTQPRWRNGSIMSMQSGSQAMGIAQGWTPTCIHISEIADIPKPQKTLEEGLFPAAHSSRKLFFILEGTGADATSWQAEKWRYYKANWGKGGRFFCVFISWPCATDLYPLPDWLRKNPIPEGWTPLEETRRMSRKAELYIRSTPYLAKIMGARWEMPKEQAWMWETKFREASQSHTLKVFLSQYPVSDDEAFQSKNDRAIGDDVIEVVSSRAEKSYEPYAITGESVLIGQSDDPYEPEPDAVDYDKPRIPITWKSKGGQLNHWTLVPLKAFDDSDDLQCFNKVLIFKHPKEDEDYSIGVDTADGLGNVDEDRACAQIVLNRMGNMRDEQVAEFVSNLVNPPQMVSICAALGTYYGQWQDGRAHTRDARGVKFCIEQRERYGDDCQFQLKLMGFSFHHVFIWYDKKQIQANQGNRLGWFSNVWSRPLLLNRFQDAINGGWIKINSPMAIRQLATWVRKVSTAGKSKLDHESGQHDDNIMGLAQAYFTRHSHDVLVNRQQLKYASRDEKLPTVSYEWCENTITI